MSEQPADAPELANLKLLDYGTEPDLLNAAVMHAQSVMPEWTPRGGNTELVLMESLAVMLGPEILAVQLVAPRMVEQLMNLYGITRNPGAAAAGRVIFTVTDSAPTQVIPAGTRLRLPLDNALPSIDLITDEALTIVTSSTRTAEVAVTADVVGTDPNGAPVGTNVEVVDNLPFIESAKLIEQLHGGLDVETDISFNARAAAAIGRQTTTLVHPRNFELAALSIVGIGRVRALDNYNPTKPGVATYGHVTVALGGPDGQPLDKSAMDETRRTLADQALASLTLHTVEADYTDLNISVTVKGMLGWEVDDVQASVRATLADWLSPVSWDWRNTVSQFEIVSVVANAPGVREVVSVPNGLTLNGVAPLPRLGTVDVEVS